MQEKVLSLSTILIHLVCTSLTMPATEAWPDILALRPLDMIQSYRLLWYLRPRGTCIKTVKGTFDLRVAHPILLYVVLCCRLQAILATHGIPTQTQKQVEPIKIRSSGDILMKVCPTSCIDHNKWTSNFFCFVGRCFIVLVKIVSLDSREDLQGQLEH